MKHHLSQTSIHGWADGIREGPGCIGIRCVGDPGALGGPGVPGGTVVAEDSG